MTNRVEIAECFVARVEKKRVGVTKRAATVGLFLVPYSVLGQNNQIRLKFNIGEPSPKLGSFPERVNSTLN